MRIPTSAAHEGVAHRLRHSEFEFLDWRGVEALMFFRDPSGNMIALFCVKPFPGADKLPRSGPAAAGKAVVLETFRYETWRLPEGYVSRVT